MLFNRKDKQSGIWSKLQSGLEKTRSLLFSDLNDLFKNRDWTNEELLEEIETRLLMADVGVESTTAIIEALVGAGKKQKFNSAEDLIKVLHNQMVGILQKLESPLEIPTHSKKPFTILMVGVNGAGKTTTIGKLANLYKQEYSLILVAGDTFRAAAIDQLKSWGDRNKVPVISHSQGADSAAVIFDGLEAARIQNADIVIADTAGRLQNKNNLIDELKKIRRSINKFDADILLEILLVLDASNGQNALVQAQQFNKEIGINGIVLTKLDGTAKGGIVFSLASKLGVPLRYIGTGEGISDLSPFNAEEFVTALLAQKS